MRNDGRIYLWLIRFIGLIVPRRLRVDWRQEWQAELQWREQQLAEWDKLNWQNKRELLWHSAGAFVDALWLQPKRWEDDMIQDLRFAVRMLAKQPGLTLIAVLTLALGIGANVAVFSLVDALLLQKLPVQQPEQLVIFKRIFAANPPIYDFPYPWYERLREQPQVFSSVAANWLIERMESGDSRVPEQVRVGMASGNYFATLGVPPLLGRVFTAEENRVPGGHPFAVISHGYWERRFARAPDVIGRTITLTETTYTIIGVMPRGFTGESVGRPADLWVPFMMASQVMPEVPGGPPKFPALIIGRLQPGVTAAQAQAASQIVFQQLQKDEAGAQPTPQRLQQIAQLRVELDSAATGYSSQRKPLTQPLAILAGMAGLILLAVCVNIANLLLARAAARERELAVRQALGAGRLRIVRQLLTESLLLAGLGGAFGVLFAIWGKNLLTTMLSTGPLATGVEDNTLNLALRLDGRFMACVMGLCLLTSTLFSLAPVLRLSKLSLTAALRGADARTSGRFAVGKALVMAQVALAVTLLLGAGLLTRTLRNLQTQDTGFDRENLLLVWMAPVRTGRTVPELADFSDRVRERLSTLPGVRSTGIANGGVLDGSVTGTKSEYVKVEGHAPKPGLELRLFTATPEFFATVSAPLVAGRAFTEHDNDAAPQVAIINETMARFFFGNENPIGKRFAGRGEDGYPTEIIGVVKDMKAGSPRDQRGVWYVPHRQGARFLRVNWCVAIRTSAEPIALAASVRQALRELDPRVPILRVTTLNGQLNAVLAQERLIATLSGFFGVLAAFLSCLGLYGVVSYTVAQRTSEIGIRLALGATPGQVLRQVLRESLRLVAVGLVIGVPLGAALMRLLATRLYGVSPTDPFTLALVIALLSGVAILAALLPARRASRIDPMIALRQD